MTTIPEVLVVCTHNAGRSVAARVLIDHYAGGRITVRSAGSAPGDTINPAVAQVLSERGLDVSKEFPKPLTDEAARTADVIITMGCGDACPVFPGKRYLDWELEDPAGKTVDEVRPIVEDVDRRARALVAEPLPSPRADAEVLRTSGHPRASPGLNLAMNRIATAGRGWSRKGHGEGDGIESSAGGARSGRERSVVRGRTRLRR